MKKSIQYIVLVISIVSILSRCGIDPVGDSGGASETVSIIVTDSVLYGKAVTITEDDEILVNPLVSVSLYEADFLPIFSEAVNNFSKTTVSDTNGEFTFRHNGAGYYNVCAKDIVTGRSLFIDSIMVRQDERDSVGAAFDDGGQVSGKIYAIDTLISDTVPAFKFHVFIIGTPFLSITDIQGVFSLDSIPQGAYVVKVVEQVSDTSLIVSDSTINSINNLESTPVSLNPGDTLQNFDIYVTQKLGI